LVHLLLGPEGISQVVASQGVFRVEVDRPFQEGEGLVHLPLFKQGSAEASMSRGVTCVEFDGLAEAGNRLVRIPKLPEAMAEKNEDLTVVRGVRLRRAQIRQGFVLPFELGSAQAARQGNIQTEVIRVTKSNMLQYRHSRLQTPRGVIPVEEARQYKCGGRWQ